MGALTDMRLELRAALTGRVLADGVALDVQDVLPEACQPPALLILPADPFLVPTPRIELMQAHWEAIGVLGHRTNPAVVPALEALLEQMLDAIYAKSNDWTIESVAGFAPIQFVEGGGMFPGVRVSISRLTPTATATT